MRFALPLLLGALVLACSISNGEDLGPPPCPAGWSYDAYSDGYCHASDEVVERNRTEITTGITGFVRLTTGSCDLCEHCTCNRRLVAGQEIQAFVASDVPSKRTFCTREGFPDLPLARTTTDSEGIYSFKLAAGEYVVVTDDPDTEQTSTPCPAIRTVSVESDVAIAPLIFDHGAY